MFKGMFGLKPVRQDNIRKSIYDPAKGLLEEKGRERKYQQEQPYDV